MILIDILGWCLFMKFLKDKVIFIALSIFARHRRTISRVMGGALLGGVWQVGVEFVGAL